MPRRPHPLPPASVLVVDDHPVFRRGVVDLLRGPWPECAFVECGTAADARALLGAAPWGLVILDQFLPDAFGIELLAGSWAPRTLVLTMHQDAALLERVRAQRAGGFLCKSEPPERLLEAAAAVAQGRTWFVETASAAPVLSERETVVLAALLAGVGPQSIARDLGLSRSSVQSYKERLFEKLKVKSLPELGRKASLLGLR